MPTYFLGKSVVFRYVVVIVVVVPIWRDSHITTSSKIRLGISYRTMLPTKKNEAGSQKPLVSIRNYWQLLKLGN